MKCKADLLCFSLFQIGFHAVYSREKASHRLGFFRGEHFAANCPVDDVLQIFHKRDRGSPQFFQAQARLGGFPQAAPQFGFFAVWHQFRCSALSGCCVCAVRETFPYIFKAGEFKCMFHDIVPFCNGVLRKRFREEKKTCDILHGRTDLKRHSDYIAACVAASRYRSWMMAQK